MQLNKVLKGLAIALPMITLTACSSTEGTESSSATEIVNNATIGQTVVTSPVVTAPVLTEKELRSQQLRQEQTIYFLFNDSDIQPGYEEMLATHAEYLRQNPQDNVIVEGHADERGTPEYNIALGERRANAIARYLQAMGVPVSQMTIVSYGEEKPLVNGHSDVDYAKNRRVVLVY